MHASQCVNMKNKQTLVSAVEIGHPVTADSLSTLAPGPVSSVSDSPPDPEYTCARTCLLRLRLSTRSAAEYTCARTCLLRLRLSTRSGVHLRQDLSAPSQTLHPIRSTLAPGPVCSVSDSPPDPEYTCARTWFGVDLSAPSQTLHPIRSTLAPGPVCSVSDSPPDPEYTCARTCLLRLRLSTRSGVHLRQDLSAPSQTLHPIRSTLAPGPVCSVSDSPPDPEYTCARTCLLRLRLSTRSGVHLRQDLSAPSQTLHPIRSTLAPGPVCSVSDSPPDPEYTCARTCLHRLRLSTRRSTCARSRLTLHPTRSTLAPGPVARLRLSTRPEYTCARHLRQDLSLRLRLSTRPEYTCARTCLHRLKLSTDPEYTCAWTCLLRLRHSSSHISNNSLSPCQLFHRTYYNAINHSRRFPHLRHGKCSIGLPSGSKHVNGNNLRYVAQS
ncbi:hypothetical protein J6590_064460 [Homalodisca vitripennis]|nr:hypothetical protein J6590_064460 [Homalodisca vitripennis]